MRLESGGQMEILGVVAVAVLAIPAGLFYALYRITKLEHALGEMAREMAVLRRRGVGSDAGSSPRAADRATTPPWSSEREPGATAPPAGPDGSPHETPPTHEPIDEAGHASARAPGEWTFSWSRTDPDHHRAGDDDAASGHVDDGHTPGGSDAEDGPAPAGSDAEEGRAPPGPADEPAADMGHGPIANRHRPTWVSKR